jgi:hypothetical protein
MPGASAAVIRRLLYLLLVRNCKVPVKAAGIIIKFREQVLVALTSISGDKNHEIVDMLISNNRSSIGSSVSELSGANQRST